MAYPSPRRLQLRRGNAAAVASYLGTAGELVVDTTNWTLYVHDGVTVGGYAATVNTASITGNINSILNGTATFGNLIPSANVTYSLGNITHQWNDLYVSNNTIYVGGVPLSIDNSGNLTINGNVIPTIGYVNTVVANVTVDLSSYALNANVTAANVGLKGYVDQANIIQSNQITAANVGLKGYVDQANTIQSAQISAANIGMKGYVDSQSYYSNAKVATYLASTTDQTFGANVVIQGNLIVNGNVSYVNVNNLVISDNIINLADLNPGDSLDLGLSAHRTVNDILQHTGLVRDASANQWRLFSNVIPQPGTTVDFTNAVYDDLLVGNILLTSVKNGAYTWTFSNTGNLTVPAGGTITAPNAQEFQLQAKDTNSLLRNEINLDPNNGTYMSVWTDETTSFSFNDWGSGSWNNESGLGAARFTDAQTLQDFWTTGIGSLGLPIEASINGGARTPNVFYDGNNGETYGVTLGLDAVPPGGQGTTVPITSLVFYYRTQSKINIDVNGGEILLDAQSMDLDLRTTNNLDLRAGQNLNLRGFGQYPVRIYTDDTTHKWEFDTTGSLTLPREGKIYGVGDGGPAGDRLGYISWDGNSSGDGSGFNTMRLVPDLQGLEDLDQYIIIDPTGGVPGHIHIRAGGTQDNSLADLYLGGENSHVKISAGLNPPVTVKANNNAWTFGTDGNITLPTNTAAINYANGVSILSELGGSSYGNAQVATYLQFGNIANVSVAGNVTANYFVGNGALLTGIVAGSNYSNVQVAAYLSTATINTTGNITAQYISGNISITGNVTGTSPNVTLQAGAFTSVFNNQGNVTVPQLYSAGNIQTSGYIYGNGAFLTGIVTSGGSGTNYSNVNVKAYTETMGFQNYGNVNVAAYISSQGLTSYSNVQVATYLPTYTGNIANIRLSPSGVLTFADGTTQITAGGGSYSNVQVAAYLTTGINTAAPQIQLTNATSNYIKYNNVGVGAPTFTTANVGTRIIYWSSVDANTADYAVGIDAGVLWHGIPRATSGFAFKWYGGTTQIAMLEGTGSFTIANIRLSPSGNIVFADGTVQTTAATGTYSNIQVATYLPTYTGSLNASNILVTSANITIANIQATTAATNPATGALRVMGGAGVAGTVFAGQFNTTGNVVANAISAYSLNTVANVTASVINAGAINSAGNVLAQNLIGTIATASQTGITAVGTLATLTVSGNATVGNLVGTEANTRIIANVYTTTFDIYGNVSFPGNITTSSSGYFMGNALGTTAAYTGNVTVGGNLTIIGTKSNVPVKTGGFVAQNTAVSIDSITAQWLNTGAASANQLQLAALNGNVSILYTYTFQDGTGGSTTGGSSSTTLANLSFGWTSIGNPSGVAGDMYNVLVTLPGTNAYRITAMTGSGYSNNVLTIERLV